MRASDALRLTALAAIWGASFIFIRVAAPALGPLWTTEGRLLVGSAVLLLWFAFTGFDVQWRRHLRFYSAIGIVGTAVPFTLFHFGGMHLPGSTMAVLNTTTPMFALLLGAAIGSERLTALRLLGLPFGMLGVWLITPSAQGSGASAMFAWAIAACLCASFMYAVSSLLVRHWGRGVPAAGMALAAQVVAAVAVVPLLPLWPPESAPSAVVLANVAALGLLGSAVAYILYFRLIANVGAASAQTVSLLVPAFGLLWGAVFLDESIGLAGLAGAACIVLGTVLITRR